MHWGSLLLQLGLPKDGCNRWSCEWPAASLVKENEVTLIASCEVPARHFAHLQEVFPSFPRIFWLCKTCHSLKLFHWYWRLWENVEPWLLSNCDLSSFPYETACSQRLPKFTSIHIISRGWQILKNYPDIDPGTLRWFYKTPAIV